MTTLVRRCVVLSIFIVLVCTHLGLTTWTLIRYVRIEHWSPGVRFFGNEMLRTPGLTRSAANNLQEGTWHHLIKVRSDGGIVVTQIEPGSPADQAGLQPGDLILSVNGMDLGLYPGAYFRERMRSRPGDAFDLAWRRNGTIHRGILTLEASDQVRYALSVNGKKIEMGVEAMTWFQRGTYLIYPFVLLCLGSWMGFRFAHKKIVFQCALLFLAVALCGTHTFYPMISGWPGWVLSVGLFGVTAANLLKATLLFLVLSKFPGSKGEESRLPKWIRVMLVSLTGYLLLYLTNLYSLTYGWNNGLVRFVSDAMAPIPESSFQIVVAVTTGYLLFVQWSAVGLQQNRRLRLLALGCVSTLILAPFWTMHKPGTSLASWKVLSIQDTMLPMTVWFFDRVVHLGLQCALPLALAYSVLVHRVFGIRFLFGRSVIYVTENKVLNLVLGIGVFVVFYLGLSTWLGGDEGSELPMAFTAAGVTIALAGGWLWLKGPLIRLVEKQLMPSVFENKRRISRLERSMPQHKDRESLVGSAGQELLDGLDLCCVAIYLKNDSGDTLNATWYGIKDVPGRASPDCISDIKRSSMLIDRALRKSSSEGERVIEYGNPVKDSVLDLSGFELIVGFGLDNRARGCISLGRKLSDEPYSNEEKDSIQVFASEMRLALDNFEMAKSLEKRSLDLKRLTRRLMEAQESERSRLAGDLHDDTGQTLTALKLNLRQTRNELLANPDRARNRLDEALELTDETMKRLRTIAHGLRPHGLDLFGLNPTLEDLCRSFESRTGVQVTYRGTSDFELPESSAICLYRVVQEALTNTLKHGDSTRVEVDLHHENRDVTLSVSDNGRGFDTDALYDPNPESGLGLVYMRERVESLDGRFEIHSKPGNGTKITVVIPTVKR